VCWLSALPYPSLLGSRSSTPPSSLIRLWREASPRLRPEAQPEGCVAPQDWQGEGEHVQIGRRWTFSTLHEMLGFLHRQVEEPEVLSRPAGTGA
jgi:hypothetical protein